MKHDVAVFLLGAATSGFLWIRLGRAHARALRAWRDFQATKQAIKGLLRKTVGEWATAVKVGLIVAVLAFVGLYVLVFG